MTMRFEFATATRIVFGAGTLRELGPIAKELGWRALVIHGSTGKRAEPVAALLAEQNIASFPFSVSKEPELTTIEAGFAEARKLGCDFVIAVGGGSVLDTGKAIAAMLTNEGELLDYLEIIGRGKPLAKPSAPLIAIPTTAGTGSEVTRNAVLASPEHHAKVSLRSPFLLPKVAIVDPELAYDLPPALTASTGLDALTQLIEPFLCSRANAMTDMICAEGIRRAARSLRAVVANGKDPAARADLALASLFSGMALANSGLGAVHGLAGAIGGMFSAPHGGVCAALLLHVVEINLRALRRRQPGSEALRRYIDLARLLTGTSNAMTNDSVEWIRKLVEDLKIPRLGAYGISTANTTELVAKAAIASSMKANPIELTLEELAEILERAV